MRNPEDPVPRKDILACTLWKVDQAANDDGVVGDGSLSWWTIAPYERSDYRDKAHRLKDAYTVNPVIKELLEE